MFYTKQNVKQVGPWLKSTAFKPHDLNFFYLKCYLKINVTINGFQNHKT